MDGIPRTHEGNLLNRNLVNIRINYSELIGNKLEKLSCGYIRFKNDKI